MTITAKNGKRYERASRIEFKQLLVGDEFIACAVFRCGDAELSLFIEEIDRIE